MQNNKLVIHANGKKAKYFSIGLPIFSIFAISVAIASFIKNVIFLGIAMLALLLFFWIFMPRFLRNKRVVFMNEHLEIPMEYVQEGIPFSKTIIPYKNLKSVEFIEMQDVDNDCVGSNGRKVPCIKFVDKEGEIYRMKVEFFSESQAFRIIDETKHRAEIVEKENELE